MWDKRMHHDNVVAESFTQTYKTLFRIARYFTSNSLDTGYGLGVGVLQMVSGQNVVLLGGQNEILFDTAQGCITVFLLLFVVWFDCLRE